MWVKAATFIELNRQLAAAQATADWMRVRVNQLERKNAMLESKLGLPPTDVPEIVSATSPTLNAPQIRPGQLPDSPTLQDLFAGNINLEDMGDEAAEKVGASWDDNGQVIYR